MAGAIATLRELHRLRRHVKGLQEEIDRAPRLLKAKLASIQRQEEELKQAHERLNQTKVAIRQNEGQLKQMHQQIAKWEGQLREITSKKEYDALQHEIQGARTKCSQLEDLILEGMSQVDEQTARLPELEKTLTKAKDDLAQFEKSSQERVGVLTEELQKAQGQVREVEAQLPVDFRQVYDRLVTARGEDALTLAKDGTCVACYTSFTQQQVNDLRAGRLVVCKSCGRIVYLADEA